MLNRVVCMFFALAFLLVVTAFADTVSEMTTTAVFRTNVTSKRVSATPYAYGDRFVTGNTTKDYNLCPEPECGLSSSGSCKCPAADSICTVGHKWHLDANQVVTKGWSHPDSTKRKTKNIDFGW